MTLKVDLIIKFLFAYLDFCIKSMDSKLSLKTNILISKISRRFWEKIKIWLFKSKQGRKMSNNENINSYIENYLNSYLKIDKPEFAILLSGKWGSGKTYFIENYIEQKDKTEDIKFIKISLFGLKNTDSIDDQIFQNLHPILGNKYAKLTGNLVKNTLKFGISLDWNDDNRRDGTSSVDLSKFNLLEYFSDKKSNKELIFVFDDLERTDIELTEILGYINYLVEQSDFKVIILANEEELRKEDEENKDYDKFKEKVIGKTFEVQHDFSTVLHSFIENKTSKSTKCLLGNLNRIENIYKEADYQNLRHINQILLDFEYFMNLIDSEYLKNEEFVSILINNFFALSIEIKSGSLKEEELWEKPNYRLDRDKKKKNVEKIYDKYNIENTPLFSGKGWVRIILKSSLNSEVINKVVSDLSFFIEKNEKEEPSWVKLWHYYKLENDHFEEVLRDVLEKFNSCIYEKPEHFLHVIALLLYFSKHELCDLSIEDIKTQVKECIKQYKTTSLWKDELFGDMIWNNRTGLGYMDQDNDDFRNLFSLIREENQKSYNEEVRIKEKNKLDNLLRSISKWDEAFMIKLLLEEYESKPIFQDLSSTDFIEQISKANNTNIVQLRYILNSRYADNKSLNGRKYYCYLIEELSFWKELKESLTSLINNTEGLKKHLLKQFNDFGVQKFIERLESCNKSN